jgi:hypothetical protein
VGADVHQPIVVVLPDRRPDGEAAPMIRLLVALELLERERRRAVEVDREAEARVGQAVHAPPHLLTGERCRGGGVAVGQGDVDLSGGAEHVERARGKAVSVWSFASLSGIDEFTPTSPFVQVYPATMKFSPTGVFMYARLEVLRARGCRTRYPRSYGRARSGHAALVSPEAMRERAPLRERQPRGRLSARRSGAASRLR